MATKFSLLGRKEYKLTEHLIVHIPTVAEIRNTIDDEMEYYSLVSNFIKTPCDLIVELDDIHLDWTQVDEYDLFLMLFKGILMDKHLNKKYWNMIFPYINIDELVLLQKQNGTVVVNRNNDLIINKSIYLQLSDLLRQIINVEKNMEYYKVPEIETRKYIIKRQRLKRERELEREKRNGKKSSSILDGVILLLVNNCNFKYNFQTVGEITLYDLYACLRQIYSDREIDGLMSGFWAGNVDLNKIDNSKLNRIIL